MKQEVSKSKGLQRIFGRSRPAPRKPGKARPEEVFPQTALAETLGPTVMGMASRLPTFRGVGIRRPVMSGQEARPVQRFVTLVAALGLAAAGLAGFFWIGQGLGRWWVFVLFLGLVFLDQAADLKFIYRVSGIKKDTTELFLMTLAMLAPPFAVFCILLIAAEAGLLFRRKSLTKQVFNVGMFSTCVFAFLALFNTLEWGGLSRFPSLAIAAVVYYFLNAFIVSTVVSYADGVPLRAILAHEGGIQFVVVLGNVSLGTLCAMAVSRNPAYVVFVAAALLVLHVGYADRMRAMTNSERLNLLMDATERAHLPALAEEIQAELVGIAQQLVKCDYAAFVDEWRNTAPNECLVPVTVHDHTKWLLVIRNGGAKFNDYDRELLGCLSTIAASAFGSLEARQLRQEVELGRETDRVRSDMIASLSHELRTPLTAIIGFSELLLGPLGDPEQRETFLEMIHSQAVRLRSLVETLLDYQALRGKGTRELTVRRFDVADDLREAVASFQTPESGFDIQLDCTEHLEVIADPVRVHQVIENLLSNAIKYSPSGGLVSVRGSRVDGKVRIEVEDHGLGIPDAAREKLFTRFYRVRNEETDHIAGTGLGLAFCHEVIEAHGGTIDYRSTEGQGSCFWFELPSILEH